MKWLRSLCFALNVVLPMAVLAVAVLLWGQSSVLKGWILLGAIPFTAVYWGILFLNFAPKNKKDILKLFIPFLLASTLMLLTRKGEGLFENWVLEASVIFTALNFCFLVGILHLFFTHSRRQMAGRLFFILLFVAAMGIPSYFFISTELSLHPENREWITFLYGIQILFSIQSFYPKLVKLYVENKL